VTPTISLEGVSFRYPDGTLALSSVSLEIPTGQRVALIGQNGSGKSTLVRQLNGLLRPTTGQVLIDGRDIAGRHVAELAAIVGLAFQNPDRQIFSSTVRAEVAFGPRNLGRRGAELDRAVEGALAAVGLNGQETAHPYDLGFSRRKLLSIASVLALDSPIVVLDEPTTGQDARGVRVLEEVVRDLAREGRTVIAITHDMRFAAAMFERLVVMREGAIVLDGAPDHVFDRSNWETLASTYIDPTLEATMGARLGLGSTSTEDALIAALAARQRA
jgi:energy-coupling factor transport system ATP-binding protein